MSWFEEETVFRERFLMKVLFASATGCDWLASTLYLGLREVVGESNLFDASGGDRSLPGIGAPGVPVMGAEDGFDLLVVNSAFRRDHGWDWVAGHLGVETRGVPGGRLLPHAKIVYVEGWDSSWDINPPPFACDMYFRREMEPGVHYPYPCHPMLFAMPESVINVRSFNVSDRPVDVACLINCKDIGIRHHALGMIESLRSKYDIAACGGGVPHGDYVQTMAHAKLAICPPGGGSDCMHQWEAIACGAIPVFVCHPARIRRPWLPEGTFLWCESVDDLPRIIDHALSLDLDDMRRRLQADALENHTTAARARRLLELTGVQA